MTDPTTIGPWHKDYLLHREWADREGDSTALKGSPEYQAYMYEFEKGERGNRPPVELDGELYEFDNHSGLYEIGDREGTPAILCGNCARPDFQISFGFHSVDVTCSYCGYEPPSSIYDG